ncbi:MAG: hypothetical protein JW793_08490 [Acidobacteria bacterium]|nr:hypothetical protein [Acidobacteriota bacterium]
MGYGYSVSMEGLRVAGNQLNSAAGKVSRPVNYRAPEAATDRFTLSGGMDIAGAMVEAQEATIIYKANLKMIETRMKLEEETLDLFG